MNSLQELNCIICIQQEAIKVLSKSIELGLELISREDVRNLILVNDYSSRYSDSEFIENVIDKFFELT